MEHLPDCSLDLGVLVEGSCIYAAANFRVHIVFGTDVPEDDAE